MPPECVYSENGPDLSGRLFASSTEQRLLELSQKCGSKDRLYRNTLLFLLPSSRGLARLRKELREVTALEAVKRDYSGQLDTEQLGDLAKRLDTARKAVTEALGTAYTYVARISGQSVVVVPLSDAKPNLVEHLQNVWQQVLVEEEWVLRKVGTVTLQKVGLILSEGGIRVKDAVEAFLRYTDKPMIAAREAVVDGLKQACKEKLIGIGRGLNLNNLQKKWCEEEVILDPNEEGLWIIPPFEREPVSVVAGESKDSAIVLPAPESTAPSPTKPDATTATTTEATTTAGKKVRRISIKGNVALENWTEVFRCFILPASRMNPKRLRLGIDFELETSDNQPLDENHPTIKAMKESARQLRLELDQE
jgi:hypothetical protein